MGSMASARFHTTAKRCGIKAHIGAEIAVSSFGKRLTPAAVAAASVPCRAAARCCCLCASRTGYQNLCQLITRFKMREATKD